MGVIVCATGNGDTSRIVQNRAVDIARRERKRLIFIHVVDVKRLGDLEEGLVPAAEMELAWLGQAVLRLARDRARRSGVDADIAIRYGQVQSSLE
ncbi:MAG: universal stress protein, partial [Anaerolineae bacterium]